MWTRVMPVWGDPEKYSRTNELVSHVRVTFSVADSDDARRAKSLVPGMMAFHLISWPVGVDGSAHCRYTPSFRFRLASG